MTVYNEVFHIWWRFFREKNPDFWRLEETPQKLRGIERARRRRALTLVLFYLPKFELFEFKRHFIPILCAPRVSLVIIVEFLSPDEVGIEVLDLQTTVKNSSRILG